MKNFIYSIGSYDKASLSVDEFYVYISLEESYTDYDELVRFCLAHGKSGTNSFFLIPKICIVQVSYSTHENTLKIKYLKDLKVISLIVSSKKQIDRIKITEKIMEGLNFVKSVKPNFHYSLLKLLLFIILTCCLTFVFHYFSMNEYTGRRAIVHLAVELLQGLGGSMILIICSVIVAIQVVFFVKKKKYKNQLLTFKKIEDEF